MMSFDPESTKIHYEPYDLSQAAELVRLPPVLLRRDDKAVSRTA